MGRAKVTIGPISDEKSRRKTFAKRKKGLVKKITELSTLCGVRVGMILYENQGDSGISEPEVWPEDPQVVSQLISNYKEQPISDSKRWSTDLSGVLQSWKRDAEIEIVRLQGMLMRTLPICSSPLQLMSPRTWDGQNLEDLSEQQLSEFGRLIDKQLEIVDQDCHFKKHCQQLAIPFTVQGSLGMEASAAAAAAQPIQSLDTNLHYQTAHDPFSAQPSLIPLQQTVICHPASYQMQQSLHVMRNNMLFGAPSVYQQQQQPRMPFVYSQNQYLCSQQGLAADQATSRASAAAIVPINSASNCIQFADPSICNALNNNNDDNNQIEAAALQYDPAAVGGQYTKWYPPGPYPQHHWMATGDSAKWKW